MNTIDITPLPYSDEMEQAALGSLLIDPVATATVGDSLKPQDFYLWRHQAIYEAVLHLGDRADLVTVATRLASLGQLDDIGGESYLAQLTLNVPTALNLETYAAAVAGDATRRRLINACSAVAKLAFDRAQDATATAERAVSLMETAGAHYSSNVVSASDAVREFLNDLEAQAERGDRLAGIPSGIPDLDAVTNGWQEADFDIISGAPGSGKTSLATQSLYYAAVQYGKRGLLFSLEMTRKQMVERFISCISGIPYQTMQSAYALTSEQWGKINNAAAKFADLPITIDDSPSLTPTQALATMTRYQRQHGLDIAVIDQLQLMDASHRQDRRLEIVEITRALKLIPKKVGGIPLLVMSQLSRGGYADGAEPGLSDLKESGSIESDADKVIFVYAPDEDYKQDVVLKVAKNRKGATMKVRAKFSRAISRFSPVEEITL